MARRLKLYLDTSVISHLDQQDALDKMTDTWKLWELIKTGRYEAVISAVTLREILKCPQPKQALLLEYLSQVTYETVPISDDVMWLADKFIEFGILRPKSRDDCEHLASALVSNCDFIASWNFKHIVNRRTIDGVKIVSLATTYRDLEIYSPTMLVEGEQDDE